MNDLIFILVFIYDLFQFMKMSYNLNHILLRLQLKPPTNKGILFHLYRD